MRLIHKNFTKAYRDAMNAEINIPSDVKSAGTLKMKNKLLEDVVNAQNITDAQVDSIVSMAGDKELTGLKKRLYDSGVNKRYKEMADKSYKITDQAIKEGKLNISDLPGYSKELSNEANVNNFSKGFLDRGLKENNGLINDIGKPSNTQTVEPDTTAGSNSGQGTSNGSGKTLDQLLKEKKEALRKDLEETQKKKGSKTKKIALIGAGILGAGALGYGLYKYNKNKKNKK